MNVFVPHEVGSLQPWADAGVLGAAEVHAAAVVARHLGGHGGALWADERVVLAFALAVWAPRHGHACIDLESVVDTVADTVAMEAAAEGASDEIAPATPGLPWPELLPWRRTLRESPLVRVVNGFESVPVLDDRPLVLSGSRLYTQRQWVDEGTVATALRRRAALPPMHAPEASSTVLDTLLQPAPHDVHTQHAAANVALTSNLAVVVGGPGTGKTHTVACLLASLVAGQPADRPVRVGLAAPTGKAAARMTEAIASVTGGVLADVDLPEGVIEQLDGLNAVTVHRLLGPRGDHRTRFKHTADKPVPYDVVIVDETSMLALPLMARLLEAVPDECRLVLVGDPDQLASIEAGAVLGDIVRSVEAPSSPLRDRVVRLVTQHRVGVSSPIGPLAEAIRRGRADEALQVLRAGDEHDRLRFVEVDDSPTGASVAWPPRATLGTVRDIVGETFSAARVAGRSGDAASAIGLAASARILCAHRRGSAGVSDWNAHVESWLFDGDPPRGDYSGRVVLATRNDPRTGIVNGETGVLVRAMNADGERGPLRAAFRRGDAIRDFAPAELDQLDTAFAMTIHKSQGSEYDTVVLVHPPSESPLVSRELLYTAVTRAKRRLVVVGSAASIRKAVETPTRRITGLTTALRSPQKTKISTGKSQRER